jgi:5-methylcytosine-specific restriction protein A
MAAWPYSTARWQRLRHAQLCAHPFCEGCKPHRMTIANHVDHRVAISAGGDAFPPIGTGLASYCAGCHSAKTARGAEAGAIKSDRPRKGCDANGMPLDPTHPWANTVTSRCGGNVKTSGTTPSRTAAPYSNSVSFAKTPENASSQCDQCDSEPESDRGSHG